MAITLNSGFNMPVLGSIALVSNYPSTVEIDSNIQDIRTRSGLWHHTSRNLESDSVHRSFLCLLKHLNLRSQNHLCPYGAQITFAVVTCVDELMLLSADYKNEQEVGEALAEAFSTGLVKREDLFITTKASLWNSDHGHVVEACKDSLKKLRLDYLDLYLVHFPVATKHTGVGTTGSALDEDGVLEIDTTISLETTWHAMEELVSMGLVRSIGISNYDIFLTRDCLAYSKVKPAVNQIETHPYFQRESLVKFCQKHGICVTAHTPLGGAVAKSEWFGSVSCLDDPVLKNLAEKYKKTAAQVVLRWGIERNTVVIPKTSKLERLKENFQLTKEDMDLIAKVDRKHRTNQPAKFWGILLFLELKQCIVLSASMKKLSSFREEEHAQAALQNLTGRFYAAMSVEEDGLWNIVRAISLDFDAWTTLIEETEKVAESSLVLRHSINTVSNTN
ncbi:hypothetical protein DVH24_006328 [Malus domestica]|uniref:NADP-dependent oxidoreductase domain-containing protein n=1 Tax=Malus domestica TaxID=3750 RepID=A0A498KCC4_MALDO|nr:hypothetical protein DVH24_006328 [Malus domestica]